MRALVVALVAVLPALAGCTDAPDPEEDDMPSDDLPDPIHAEGTIGSGTQIAEWDFLTRERVQVTIRFASDTQIEYAAITLQDCDTQTGSGTGAVEGGTTEHTDTFSPGHGCIQVETQHTEPFDYTMDVTFALA